jgi:hypothetical protein
VFGQVLELCARAGLVGLNIVAIDGSKIAANASREANRDYERLAREVIEDARQIDAEEDEQFGQRRGDDLPPESATSGGRMDENCSPSCAPSRLISATGGSRQGPSRWPVGPEHGPEALCRAAGAAGRDRRH